LVYNVFSLSGNFFDSHVFCTGLAPELYKADLIFYLATNQSKNSEAQYKERWKAGTVWIWIWSWTKCF